MMVLEKGDNTCDYWGFLGSRKSSTSHSCFRVCFCSACWWIHSLNSSSASFALDAVKVSWGGPASGLQGLCMRMPTLEKAGRFLLICN